MDKFLVIDLDMDLRSARADFEKKYLIAQINNFNGNIDVSVYVDDGTSKDELEFVLKVTLLFALITSSRDFISLIS